MPLDIKSTEEVWESHADSVAGELWISEDSLVEYLRSYWKGTFNRGEFDKAGVIAVFKADIENQCEAKRKE